VVMRAEGRGEEKQSEKDPRLRCFREACRALSNPGVPNRRIPGHSTREIDLTRLGLAMARKGACPLSGFSIRLHFEQARKSYFE
jgi:hypothetical protein